MTDTKAEQATAKAGSTQAGSAVPVTVAPKTDAQPQAAKVEAQPRQGIGPLRMAAVVALAAMAGALGGLLATSDLSRFASAGFTADDGLSARLPSLEASVARIESDIPTLRANAEYASEIGIAKLNETNSRLDKLEKAQAEPAAKLARLSDAVDKLRTASLVAPTTAAAATVTPAATTAAPETTSSIAPPATPVVAATPEVARLPTVQGWRLRGIANGIALIQGRRGLFEVYPGTVVPGVGRVDAIRRQDGRWVVVTTKGLIVGHWRPAASPRREAIALPY